MKSYSGNKSRKIEFVVSLFFIISFAIEAQTIVTQSFDGTTFPPTGWTLYSSTGANWDRVTTGSEPITTTHSGAGMVRYNAYSFNVGNYGNMITPSFDLLNRSSANAYVKFWMYRDDGYSTSADKVDIYINTSSTTVGATLLGTINRSRTLSPSESSNGWYLYEFAFPSQFNGSINYLIFKATSGYGNNIFVDDIEYTTYPSEMEYVSSTTEQVSELSYKTGAQDCKIIRLNVVTQGELSKFDVTSIKFNTTGCTNTTDLSSAKVYYTTSTTFTTNIQFGTTVNLPNGEFTVTGENELASGNNYFWLVYNIASGAIDENQIDAQCVEFTTNESGNPIRNPAVTNPAGSSTIKGLLTGNKTIANSGGDYENLFSAITDLNESGVGSGGVTILITDGQTFDEPGLINITATGTEANPIIIKQSGTGNKPVLKFTGTSGSTDACIKISGSDYITFDGLEIRDDNTSNTVEYGFYLLGLATDGCRNNTVKNCIVDLYLHSQLTKGVYSFNDASSVEGSNNYNKFYNNLVTECYTGYHLLGNYYYPDENNEIGTIDGGISEIKSLGGNATSAINGIMFLYQRNISVFNNKLYNFNTSSTYIYGIRYEYCYDGTIKIYNNEIQNFSSTSGSTGTIYAIVSANDCQASCEIYNNDIHGFNFDNEDFLGINTSYGNTKIFSNKIYDITYTGTSYRTIKGIVLSQNGIHNVYNNMIYDLKSLHSTSFSSSYPTLAGIYIGTAASNTFMVYADYNTVFLNYVSDNEGNRSAAIFVDYSTSYTSSRITLRNNIFVNNNNVTIGALATAFWYKGTNTVNLSTSTTNNLYYAGTPGLKNLIYFDGSNSLQTIQQYRTYIATRDQVSFSELPPFVNTTNNIDTHIKPDETTQVEGSGAPISTPLSIGKDFDNQDRDSSSPDLGADEGTFTFGNDGYPPTINFSNISDGVVSNEYQVNGFSINDKSGVNTESGTRPRLYYKKSTDANVFNNNNSESVGWKYVEANNTSSPFQFTIDYTKLNSYPVVAGNIINYFVVAQDLANIPNIAINVGTFNSSPISINLGAEHFPIGGTLKSYQIRNGIEGEILVGSGQLYTTLTGADGLFNEINNSVVTGNITIKITSNISETGAIALNAFNSNYSLSIQPNSAELKILSGSCNYGLIRFNGADNITIDGRYEGEGKYLAINNSNLGYTVIAGLQFISLGVGSGSINNTIKNCIIYNQNFDTQTYGIYIGNQLMSIDSSGADNDNYLIENNSIFRSRYGVCVLGKSSGKNNNIVIKNNTLGYKEAKYYYIGQYGIYVKETDGAEISNNEIFNVNNHNNNMGKLKAIFIGTGVLNLDIMQNNIYNVIANSTSYSQGAAGIEINTGLSSSNIVIANNSIGRINCLRGLTNPLYLTTSGICVLNISGGIKIYNNSIALAGSNGNYTSYTEGIYFGTGVTNIELVNNSIYNSIRFSTNITAKAYAIYSDAASSAFTLINNNNYYALGAQGVLGYLGGVKANIEEWRLATGQDANSFSSDPEYLNDNYLKPLTTSPLLNAGTPLPNILTDIQSVTRNISTPTVGAYEGLTEIPEIDWCNLVTGNATTIIGKTVNYYAKIFETGVTENMDQGANVSCWIGYSRENTNPNTWNDSTWITAYYNVNGTETEGKDIFYRGMGLSSTNSNLPPGTYYIASRFKLKYGNYKYGGYNASGEGIWNGTTNVNAVLTITDPEISWANYDLGNPTELTLGSNKDFYGRVVVEGLTTLNTTPGSRLKAWIGFSKTDVNPNTWADTSWVTASIENYTTAFHATKDQFSANTGSQLYLGKYYVATRFQLDSDDYVYGGYSTDGGGIWNEETNGNGEINVVNALISWANLNNPNTMVKNDASEISVYGYVNVPDITSEEDSSIYLKAWIGFNTTNTNPNTWTFWKQAYFYDYDYEGNHIYLFEGIEPVGVGTYYYAFRYKFGIGDYVYGGYSNAGGGFWDGTTNISGTLTVNGTVISTFPYFEGFEDSYPMVGWRADNWDNWDLSDFTHSGDAAIGVDFSHTPEKAFLQSPKINLGANMRIKFWWMDQDPSYIPDGAISPGQIIPQIVEHDTTYLQITTDNGITWETLAFLSKIVDETQFNKEVVNLTGYADRQVRFRWYDITDNTDDAYGMILDDVCIEKIPDATNFNTVTGGNGSPIAFGTTGVTLQFTIPNSSDLGINVDRIQNSPGGILPIGLTTMASRYWIINIESGELNGGTTYTVALDLTGIGGISDYSRIHLIKRVNSNDDWEDLGTPDDLSGVPILKWTGLTSFSEFGLGSTEDNAFPVELSSFVAEKVEDNIQLSWSTETEINLNRYSIERCVNDGSKQWSEIGYIDGNGNSNNKKDYSFLDKLFNGGSKFCYRLKIIDNDGTYKYSNEVEIEIIPTSFDLLQNYPNPFNPETKIKFSLPKTTKVYLGVYNAIGELVSELINQQFDAGYYEYLFNASELASGVYYYRIVTSEFNTVKKMLLIK